MIKYLKSMSLTAQKNSLQIKSLNSQVNSLIDRVVRYFLSEIKQKTYEQKVKELLTVTNDMNKLIKELTITARHEWVGIEVEAQLKKPLEFWDLIFSAY